MKRGRLLIGVCIVSALVAAVAVTMWPQRDMQGLAYEGRRDFQVGEYLVQIETRPASPGLGDHGPALVIVNTEQGQVQIDSVFERDKGMDVRPAYVSHRGLDAHPALDLVIWLPRNGKELVATRYVSSADGRLHTLDKPLSETHDLSSSLFL
ncbi:MAG: hypothetical protein R3E83_08125 [Burkholderiaceae bacterium]